MENSAEIIVSRESAIMAFGVAPKRRWLWPLAVASIGVILVIIFAFIGWLLLRAAIPIPSQTVLLISVSPKQARAISPALERRLPPLWRQALQGSSRWRVILGTFKGAAGWHHFVIVPRWKTDGIDGKKRISYGLATFIAESADSPETTRLFRYTSLMRQAARVFPKAMPFFSETPVGLFPDIPDAVDLSWERRSLRTSIPLEPPAFETPMKRADLSIVLSTIPHAELERIPIVETLTAQDFLPGPVQLNMDFVHATGIRFEAVYPQSISSDQAKRFVSGLLKQPTIPMILPDGTVVYEEKTQNFPSQPPISFGQDHERLGFVEINDRVLRLHPKSQNFQDIAPSCGSFMPHARISEKYLSETLQKMGIPLMEDEITSVQIGSMQKHLAFCFE